MATDASPYQTVKDFAAERGLSEQRVRVLIRQGRVTGAFRLGRAWLVPVGAGIIPAAGRWGRGKRDTARGQ